ncbi:CopL family metal-binding regulatory protein [Stenotrophomonas mori]|uniref:CopL family metal-binding regulatory protein n=1 Tax=Stenotrophomonas mori TaxID=2871096 RepID=A0ABT0SIS6_9GAMM|nr:CopL family metal-binding regulatory protein [Stenotrophomonas mori]MCL7715233.1 CopL family metal-binding regulatory protein [Stenotrophomonas mori]
MPYRCWLPLLLICVLAAEGVLGAWAGGRMALDALASVADGRGGAAAAECSPVVPATSAVPAHAGHGGRLDGGAGDCTCVDAMGCECVCVLALYPPTTVALFAGRYPPVAFDAAVPAPQLPASKLSRVFRPPIA